MVYLPLIAAVATLEYLVNVSESKYTEGRYLGYLHTLRKAYNIG